MFYSNGAYSLFKVDTPVISGGATPPSFQDIYSYEFDGVDDYIDCGDNDNLSFGNTTNDFPFTFSVWAKIDDLNSGHSLIEKQDASNNREYVFYIGSDGAIGNYIYSNGVTLNRRGRKTSTGLISINTWYHIAWTYDGQGGTNASDGIKIYLDGLRVDNANNQKNSYVAMRNTSNPFKIGEFIAGNIDEVSVFNSELSASDITSIYNSGIPNNLNDLSTPPLSWWRMGESASWDGSNWTLTDQGIGGNNATTQNMAEVSRVLDVPPNPFANTKSILLDGIDDLVTMGDVLNMANDGTDAFSYSVWYKTTDTGLHQMFISKQMSSVWLNGVGFSMRGDLQNFQFGLGTGQGNQRIRGKTGTISGIRDGNWHHVCLTYDGSQLLSGFNLYYDNAPLTILAEGTQGTPNNVSTSGQADFIIGSRGLATSPNLPFNGNLDEVSYFTSKLTASDVTSIYGTGVPNDISSLNPIGWWRCGDGDTSPTLTDNGSGGNDGTMTNFSTFSTDVPTFNTKSILLDGIDDFVDMGNTLDFTNTDAFSISCWFKRTRNGVSEFLVSKQDSTSNSRGYTLLIPFDDNKVTLVIRNNTASSGRLIVDCATAITDTNWHNVVMTYDGSSSVGGINLYLDGNNDTGVTSGTLSATISNSASFQIGAKNGGNEFSGNLDEVSVFNSELSESDVTSIYGGGVPSSLSSYSSLISWWRCGDSDTSPILTDNGSGGNDGTMTNFTTFSTDVPT